MNIQGTDQSDTNMSVIKSDTQSNTTNKINIKEVYNKVNIDQLNINNSVMSYLNKRAITIAVEGCNCAGKGYFCSILYKQLINMGLRVLCIKAPLYEIQEDQIQHYGPELYTFLNPIKYNKTQQVYTNEQLDQMFKVNRQYIQQHYISKHLDQYDVIIIDRWTVSGIVYSSYRSQLPRLRSNSDEISIFTNWFKCLNTENKLIQQPLYVGNYLKATNDDLPNSLQQMQKSIEYQNDAFLHLQYDSNEIVPDLTVFIDTDINEILQRVQNRSNTVQNQSTSNQIYSNRQSIYFIRNLFRYYINQHCHRQKFLMIQSSADTEQVIKFIQQQIPKKEQSLKLYSSVCVKSINLLQYDKSQNTQCEDKAQSKQRDQKEYNLHQNDTINMQSYQDDLLDQSLYLSCISLGDEYH